jgi:hypothetical protein
VGQFSMALSWLFPLPLHGLMHARRFRPGAAFSQLD